MLSASSALIAISWRTLSPNIVAPGEERRAKSEERRAKLGRQEPESRQANHCSLLSSLFSLQSGFADAARAEQPGRPQDEDEEEEDEGDRVAIVGGIGQSDAEDLGQAEEVAADDCAGDRAHPAEDDHGQALQLDRAAHRRVEAADGEAVEDAG